MDMNPARGHLRANQFSGGVRVTQVRFFSLPTIEAEAFWAGGPDANGQKPELHVSRGDGVPCRHCQQDVAEGESYLILAYRPFPRAQPYAEVGPIFLHAAPCTRYSACGRTPAMFLARESYLLKGYGADDRIVYGTGQIVAPHEMGEAAAKIFARGDVHYIHVRSALNNCYACRIDRAGCDRHLQ
jgi:Protein of unknown function (DUF1203)